MSESELSSAEIDVTRLDALSHGFEDTFLNQVRKLKVH